ncbi:hypothetical protein AKO1_005640 [Acrasis kona]|uniref:Uncharacterized protein n=1 Tax=Acrasis kona TaxID=1008807 RepID=A0AAW2YIK6_9EUKA
MTSNKKDTRNTVNIYIACFILLLIGAGGTAWDVCSITLSRLNRAPLWLFILGLVCDGLFFLTASIGIMSVLPRKMFKIRLILTVVFIISLSITLIAESARLALNIYEASIVVYDRNSNINEAYRVTQIILICAFIFFIFILSSSFIKLASNQLKIVRMRAFEQKYELIENQTKMTTQSLPIVPQQEVSNV